MTQSKKQGEPFILSGGHADIPFTIALEEHYIGWRVTPPWKTYKQQEELFSFGYIFPRHIKKNLHFVVEKKDLNIPGTYSANLTAVLVDH